MYKSDIYLICETSSVEKLFYVNDCLPSICIGIGCLNSPAKGRKLCASCIENGIDPYPLPNYQTRTKKAIKGSTPKWANPEKIMDIYAECSAINKLTGILHHVDHIVPLRNRKVCGLHCEHNLRVIPATENLTKKNKFIEKLAYI